MLRGDVGKTGIAGPGPPDGVAVTRELTGPMMLNEITEGLALPAVLTAERGIWIATTPINKNWTR
jgi:hypothetical protein